MYGDSPGLVLFHPALSADGKLLMRTCHNLLTLQKMIEKAERMLLTLKYERDQIKPVILVTDDRSGIASVNDES
ncbi:hypothetical protein PoB_002867100 [Plakobranchus ocellatus]|uniref:Uncharacterized protein n=1 Tax=Plakobranchus ocellatus TaxID=259542 RepID=A0AAV4A1X0_9GAST|nr:hypothetical protein PoB_002867100 [Plakobranchus ocellatus]